MPLLDACLPFLSLQVMEPPFNKVLPQSQRFLLQYVIHAIFPERVRVILIGVLGKDGAPIAVDIEHVHRLFIEPIPQPSARVFHVIIFIHARNTLFKKLSEGLLKFLRGRVSDVPTIPEAKNNPCPRALMISILFRGRHNFCQRKRLTACGSPDADTPCIIKIE